MNHNTNPTEICLRSLLSTGPRNSRDVLAAMTALQFTPKQVRRARERQGVVIERSGNGTGMHSTWRLPDEPGFVNCSATAAVLSNLGADVPLHGRHYEACGDAPRTSHAPCTGTAQRAMTVASCASWMPAHRPSNSANVAGLPGAAAPKSIADLAHGAGVSPRTMDQAARAQKHAAVEVSMTVTDGERYRRQARIVAFELLGVGALEARTLADALVARDRDGLRATGSCAECQCPSLNSCPTVPRPAAEIHECWYRRQCTP